MRMLRKPDIHSARAFRESMKHTLVILMLFGMEDSDLQLLKKETLPGKSCKGRENSCESGTFCDVDKICRFFPHNNCTSNPDNCQSGHTCDVNFRCVPDKTEIGETCLEANPNCSNESVVCYTAKTCECQAGSQKNWKLDCDLLGLIAGLCVAAMLVLLGMTGCVRRKWKMKVASQIWRARLQSEQERNQVAEDGDPSTVKKTETRADIETETSEHAYEALGSEV